MIALWLIEFLLIALIALALIWAVQQMIARARSRERAQSYAHFDIFAWTPTAKPGRPVGGEAQGIRALFSLCRERWPA